MDIGRTHQQCVVLDADGGRLLSRPGSPNDEPELLALLPDVLALGEEVSRRYAMPAQAMAPRSVHRGCVLAARQPKERR